MRSSQPAWLMLTLQRAVIVFVQLERFLPPCLRCIGTTGRDSAARRLRGSALNTSEIARPSPLGASIV